MCTKKDTLAESRPNPSLPWRNPFWRGFALSHTGESFERKIPFCSTRQPRGMPFTAKTSSRVPHQPEMSYGTCFNLFKSKFNGH
jgi:hypothetical protein